MTVYPHENGDRDGTFTYKILKGGKKQTTLDFYLSNATIIVFINKVSITITPIE